jgi:collagen type III alpha
VFDFSHANGFTTRYADTAMLTTPAALFAGLRLDYSDQSYIDRNGRPPYRPDDASCAVLRFSLRDTRSLTPAFGGP